MAELSLRDYQNKQTFLNFRGQINPDKQKDLFGRVVEMFEFATKNKKMMKNLIDFREKNGFDLYFRYLAELSRWEFDDLFCQMGFALLTIIESFEYRLPDIYRKLSLLLLNQVSKSQEYFVPIVLCRINRFFFYDSGHKKLFTDVLENALIAKKPEFDLQFENRLSQVDHFIFEKLKRMGFLIPN